MAQAKTTTLPRQSTVKGLLERYRPLSMKELAEDLGVKLSTLTQRKKRTAPVPQSFLDSLRDKLEQYDSETRENIKFINEREFNIIDHSIYDADLPNLDIDNIRVSPSIALGLENSRDTTKESPQALEGEESAKTGEAKEQSWTNWKHATYRRIDKYYQDQKEHKSCQYTIIAGDPGSGKTTFLKRLLHETQQNKDFPYSFTTLFIPLSVYQHNNNDNGFRSLLETTAYFYTEVLDLRSKLDLKEFFMRELDDCKILLLLDSLDEADHNQREKVLNHIKHCKAPIILTSRHIKTITQHKLTPYLFHMGKLSPKGVLNYLETNIQRLETEAHDLSAQPKKKITHTLRAISFKIQSLTKEATLKQAKNKGLLYTDRNTTISRSKLRLIASAKEQLQIIGRPIYLNLYISACLHHGIHDISIERILGEYLEFLIGKWSNSRSINPSQRENLDVANLKRSLAYTAFEESFSENIYGKNLRLHDLKNLLEDFLSFTDQSSLHNSKIRDLVTEQIEHAHTAQIFGNAYDTETNPAVNFSHPSEAFSEFYLSKFIELATSYPFDILDRPEKPTRVFIALQRSRFREFLNNPNLRFFEGAMIIYLRSLSTSGTVISNLTNSFIEMALYTPLIPQSVANQHTDDINKILPLNLIFAGSCFFDENFRNAHYNLYLKCRENLEKIHNTTNFSNLFESLLPIHFGLQPRDEVPAQEDDPKTIAAKESYSFTDFRSLDRAWRQTGDCRGLIDLARLILKPQRIDLEKSLDEIEKTREIPIYDPRNERYRTVLSRRIAYKLRYHSRDFDDTAMKWITSYLHEHQDDLFHRSVAEATLLSIYSNIDETSEPLYSQIRNLAKNILASKEDSAKSLIVHFESIKKLSPCDFANAIANDPNIAYYDLADNEEKLKHALNFHLNSSSLPLENFASFIFQALRDAHQQRRSILLKAKHKGSKNEAESQRRREGIEFARAESKILLLIRLFIDSYYRQQFFMPEEYRLVGLDRDLYPKNITYDREEFIRLLFKGAAEGLAMDSLETSDDWAIGGVPIFEHYVKTIWAVTRYVPHKTHYDPFPLVGIDFA